MADAAASAVVPGLADKVAEASTRIDCTLVPPTPSHDGDNGDEWTGPYLELAPPPPSSPPSPPPIVAATREEEEDDSSFSDAMDLDVPPASPPPPDGAEREHAIWYAPLVIDPILNRIDEYMSDVEHAVMHAVFLRASANWTRHRQRTTRRARTIIARDETLDPSTWAKLTDDERVAAADQILASTFGTQPRVNV